jgi:hypothetical protein
VINVNIIWNWEMVRIIATKIGEIDNGTFKSSHLFVCCHQNHTNVKDYCPHWIKKVISFDII